MTDPARDLLRIEITEQLSSTEPGMNRLTYRCLS